MLPSYGEDITVHQGYDICKSLVRRGARRWDKQEKPIAQLNPTAGRDVLPLVSVAHSFSAYSSLGISLPKTFLKERFRIADTDSPN